MGYVAPIDTIDVSNSNTPGAVDITNPVGTDFVRAGFAATRFPRTGFATVASLHLVSA
jgi:hypothetical protein